MSTRYNGVVKFFNDVERFGMIRMMPPTNNWASLDELEDVFVHLNDLSPNKETETLRRLYTGEYVTFELELSANDGNQNKAKNVKGAFNGPLLMEHGDLEFQSYSYAYLKSNSD